MKERNRNFSVLLVSQDTEELGVLCNRVKRHFPLFHTAKSEEEALSKIVKHQTDVLIMGLDTIQENEIFYLHLLSAGKNIDNILFKKILFCGREDIKQAFSICNKGVFDDYFITKPLYDPYHLLLRLRFFRWVRQNRYAGMEGVSVEGLCGYLDQIINNSSDICDLNQESYSKVTDLILQSIEQMKSKITDGGGLTQQQSSSINTLIDNHTQNHLVESVRGEQRNSSQLVEKTVKKLVDGAKSHKQEVMDSDNIVYDDSNILLLEDEDEQRANIKQVLDKAGYRSQTSNCAKHTMKLLENWKPEIILLDLSLPDISAFFVLDKILNDPEMTNSRVMVLAKPGESANADEAMKMGVHEVLMKPVDSEMLLYKLGHNMQCLLEP